MILITCPSCSTQYSLNITNNNGKAKKMRCGKCSHQWILDANNQKNQKLSTENVDNSENFIKNNAENTKLKLKNNEQIVSHGTIIQTTHNKKINKSINKNILDTKIRQSIVKTRRKNMQINPWMHAIAASCMVIICFTVLIFVFYEELPHQIQNPLQKNLTKIGVNAEKISNFQLEDVNIMQDLTGKIKISGKIHNLTNETHQTPKISLILQNNEKKKQKFNLQHEVKTIEKNGLLDFFYEISSDDIDDAIIALGNSLKLLS